MAWGWGRTLWDESHRYCAGELSAGLGPFNARRMRFMPNVSVVRAAGTRESAARSGNAISIATGAGAMDGGAAGGPAGAAADAEPDTEAGGGAAGLDTTAESPGRTGADPANAGPGVIGTRAGAIVTRCAGF